MNNQTSQIKFINKRNPSSQFDIIDLYTFLHRKDLDHTPFDHHLVEFYVIILIDKGDGQHHIDFNEYHVTSQTLLTIRKDQMHKFYPNSDLHGTMLLFTDQFLFSYLEKRESQKTLRLFNELISNPFFQLNQKDYNLISRKVNRIKTEYFEIMDEYSKGIIRSELHILITKLFRMKSKHEKIIVNKKYLNEFIRFQALVEKEVLKTRRVRDYANMMLVSSKTLNNISKNIVNKPAKEFIDEICIKQIKRMLINTNLTVKEIAFATGFEETTNFYKYFKRNVQTTPEQFRLAY